MIEIILQINIFSFNIFSFCRVGHNTITSQVEFYINSFKWRFRIINLEVRLFCCRKRRQYKQSVGVATDLNWLHTEWCHLSPQCLLNKTCQARVV